MTTREQAELTERLLEGRMPPDCLRVQVWRFADGVIDGGAPMTVRSMKLADGLAYLATLRIVATSIERDVLAGLAELPDIRQRGGLVGGELAFVAPHLAVVGIYPAPLAILIAIVKQWCARQTH